MFASEFLNNYPDARRQAVAAALTAVLLGMALLLDSLAGPGGFVVMAAAFVAGLWFPVQETVENLARRVLDVDALMILVALGAWALGHPAEGALLLVLFGASRAMEAYARTRTHRSVEDLVAGLPRRATRLCNGAREEVAVDELRPEDIILVLPGERVPVDAAFIAGATTLDCSAITGEAEPVVPQPGQELPSGAINGGGLLEARVLRPAADSAWQKVIALIENAPARRSPAEALADRVGRIFTWVILGASAAGFLAWWLGAGLELREAAYRAMVLLVAGSPCALVLSLPSAILAAIASGARRGILFNGGRGLAALSGVQTVAFDKTGTLTTGEPSVHRIDGAADDEQLLAVALGLASCSTHPASRSIVSWMAEHHRHLAATGLEQVEEIPGEGMHGRWNGKAVALGRSAVATGTPAVGLMVEGVEALRFALRETIRPDAAATIEALEAAGFQTCVLSGDQPGAVSRLAKRLGIQDARGGLRPEDKVAAVKAFAARGPIAMVGDGVNDAPALAAATVGIAMGVRGSAATLAQADIVLAKDRLGALVEAADLARRTRRIVWQNLAIACGAAGLMLVTAGFGALPLALGVFGHEGGTVLVVVNSLRLLRMGAAERRPAKPTLAGYSSKTSATGTRSPGAAVASITAPGL